MSTLVAVFVAAILAVPAPGEAKDDVPGVKKWTPEPQFMFLKAAADGKIYVAVESRIELPNGDIAFTAARVELKDVQGLSITTTNGTKVEPDAATKRLARGAYVLVPPSRSTAISPDHLRMFRSDVLVLVAPGVVGGWVGDEK